MISPKLTPMLHKRPSAAICLRGQSQVRRVEYKRLYGELDYRSSDSAAGSTRLSNERSCSDATFEAYWTFLSISSK